VAGALERLREDDRRMTETRPAALTTPCLSVVMPCFNEEITLHAAIKRVLELPFVAELIVVDDGSADGSRDVLAHESDPRVRVVLHERNEGKGAALRTGFGHATAAFVAVQDADLEYDPADLELLLEPLLDGRADVVFGSRFLTTEARRVLYFWHSLGNRVLTTWSNMVTNLNLTDMETCYKVFRREVLQQITIEEDRFGVEPELTAKVAALGCRIYEVGISYDGRSYAEGKKIGWRDGVRAMIAIPKHSVRAKAQARRAAARASRGPASFAAADEELASTLHSLDGARNYAAWLSSLIRPHLSGRILEVGAGHGTFSEHLAELGPLVASEPSPRSAALLRERLADRPDIEVVEGDLAALTAERRFDGIVLLNVLEHIEDDDEALRLIHDGLEHGGRVALLVPAFEVLYSRFDAAVGHHRRYRLPELVAKVEGADLQIVEARYVNSAGFFAWLATARLLKLTPTKSALATTYDRLVVPMVRAAESRVEPPFGQSCFVVAER
jgi:SAM-dependent methyltransferase